LTWLKSISAVPPEKLPLWMLCFCISLHAQLMRNLLHIVHCLWIKKNFLWNINESPRKKNYSVSQAAWDSKWLCCWVEAFRDLIYFQFNGRVSNNISDLRKIKGVGAKIAILTLMYGFGKKKEVSFHIWIFLFLKIF